MRWVCISVNFSTVANGHQGLGKTIQVISFLSYLKEQGKKGPHLIVVPYVASLPFLVDFLSVYFSDSVHPLWKTGVVNSQNLLLPLQFRPIMRTRTRGHFSEKLCLIHKDVKVMDLTAGRF